MHYVDYIMRSEMMSETTNNTAVWAIGHSLKPTNSVA